MGIKAGIALSISRMIIRITSNEIISFFASMKGSVCMFFDLYYVPAWGWNKCTSGCAVKG